MLADESTVSVSMAGVGQQGDLWIHAHNLSVAECAMTFMNPAKTAVMSIEYDEGISDRFEGFTEPFYVSLCEGFVKVGLGRGAGNE